jgi:lipooligosaccharide transport system ATP-binding protein
MQLETKKKEQVRALSGGMRRRLVIARALMARPRLLVLDEPTTGLDPQARQLVWAKVRELKSQGVTVLLTTHYMDEAERLSDRLVIMDHGHILEEGRPLEVIERVVGTECLEFSGMAPEEQAVLAKFLEPDMLSEWQGDSWVVFGSDLDRVIRRWQEAGHDLFRFYRRRAGLEDVFLRLTGRDLRE